MHEHRLISWLYMPPEQEAFSATPIATKASTHSLFACAPCSGRAADVEIVRGHAEWSVCGLPSRVPSANYLCGQTNLHLSCSMQNVLATNVCTLKQHTFVIYKC